MPFKGGLVIMHHRVVLTVKFSPETTAVLANTSCPFNSSEVFGVAPHCLHFWRYNTM